MKNNRYSIASDASAPAIYGVRVAMILLAAVALVAANARASYGMQSISSADVSISLDTHSAKLYTQSFLAEADTPIPGYESLEEYLEFVEQWHANRIEALHRDQGWLTLTGLYWLSEGEQMFGSGERARVRFPRGSIPEIAGIFELKADTVHIRVAGDLGIRDQNGRLVSDRVIYADGRATELTYRTLTWFVIQRDDLYGIRLYDDNSPHLQHFDGIDRYETDPRWRIEAEFTPGEEGATMLIENVLGQMVEYDVAGTLSYTVDDYQANMVALGTGERLFIPFADATSGTETYPGGRFLYIDRPRAGEPAIIDYNVSYNPPCAINPHTTCPLPPPQNRLPFAIRAGEMHYEMYQETD